MEPAKVSKERRTFGRRTVFKQGTIVFDDGRRIDGTVLDLSEGGARIKVSDPDPLFGEFFLEVPSDDLIVRCCAAHVDAGVAGLRYLRPPRRLSWLKK
ncbi:MAG: PilZ domain-containing protein [Proteobacteria bacterium]|nr:PilZ domain-containing protein [Pseudomonadota bacterium]